MYAIRSYYELEEIFDRISADLSEIIERKPEFRDGPFILPLDEVTRKDREQVGEKMANLGELVITSYSIHYTKLYELNERCDQLAVAAARSASAEIDHGYEQNQQ